MSNEAIAAGDAPQGAPVEIDQGVNLPRPIEHEGIEKPGEPAKPAKDAPIHAESIRRTLKDASDKLKAREEVGKTDHGVRQHVNPKDRLPDATRRRQDIENADAGVKSKTEANDTANREHSDAPARFSEDAKKDWATTPATVRAEVHRATREMEQGIQKYKPDAEAYARVKDFDTIARQNGRDLRQALEKVVAVEQAFARNPVQGLQMVCQMLGTDLHKLARHVAGMRPEQLQAQEAQSQVQMLQSRLQQMEQRNNQMVFNMQYQATAERVKSFASRPRFHELASEITKEIAAGYSLEEAYDRAVKLAGPAVNPAGQKSINGGGPPSGGWSKGGDKKGATREQKVSNDRSDTIKRAMASVGRR